MAKLFITSLLFFFFFFFFFFFVIVPISTNAASYNVIQFGAKPNGQTVATKAFLFAWSAACKSTKPSTLYVPQGKFLLKQIVFEGPCRNIVTVKIDGTLLAPPNYWALGNTGNWILFIHVYGISVYGGTLDGRGSRFWTCRRFGKNCPQGARSITFSNSKNIVISGLTSINSQMSHMNINGCTNVVIKGVNIYAPSDSPNTDGIHVQSSYGVTITDSSMKTGDDCISIGPGTKKLLIDRVKCGPGHGISIGSLARDYNEAGVEGVTVRNTVFTGSDNGLRIKSWARPSTGYVKGILYQNIVMNNVKNPIIIDQMYCPGNQGCPNQHSGIPINGVTYQNVHGSSATPVAVQFHCSASNPCRGIKMHNVKLTHMNRPAQSFCANADGTTSGYVIPGSCLVRDQRPMEAMAIKMGLMEAKERGLSRILVLSDAQAIVNAVNKGGTNYSRQARQLVMEILDLMKDFEICRIRYIAREFNKAADGLVNFTFQCNLSQSWESCPNCIQTLVDQESIL